MKTPEYYIIDFDSTFIKIEALDALSFVALKNNPKKDEIVAKISDITKLGMEGAISFPVSLSRRLALFKANKTHIESLIKVLKKNISPSIARNKTFFKKNADSIYIISGGFKEYITPLVKPFGISEKHILANSFTFDKKGDISGYDEKNLLSQKNGKAKQVKKLQDIISDEIGKLEDYNVGNGAAVVMDSKTGEILAMVGSYDYYNDKYGKFNAALGSRQPGSTLKPIAYTLAFEKGYTPSTVLMDVKTSFPDQGGKEYSPVNYDGKFHGPIQLRFALGNSLNIPAVKLLSMIGMRDFLSKADALGLHTLAPTDANMARFGLSIVLGGGEVRLLDLTSAYSAFARGGTAVDAQPIDEVKDFNNKIIYKSVNSKEKRVFSPEVSFLTSHILSDNNARADEFGLNSYLNVPGKTVAVKTGTTDDKRDNWAIGYTNEITVGVWAGNNDNTPMNPKIASGATGASSIWYRIMNQLLKKYGDGIKEKPEKVKAVTVDSYLGGLPKDSSKTRAEYFIDSSEPKDISPFYKTLKISKANGKLANDIEVKLGQYDSREFIVFSESDPVSTDGKNRWQEAIEAWLKDQKEEKFHPPNETSDASSDTVVVSIKSPNGSSTVNSN
jgi:membrane carboxypeptidase/penicillin-binding protein PbpC